MLAYALFVFSIAYAHGLQVNTTEGVVEGPKASDGDYYTFYGIPYAGTTSGQNRFKGPVPPLRRSTVFRATDTNVICAQPSSRGLIGVEDCLTLDVITKNTTTPKPVIVWLNSEEYTTTLHQMFSFRKISAANVVFVKMNFRLSIFGFLCLGVQEAPGNAGLKDVIQGLKWIKANIANFGGDPNNVILMGHASGAAMVDLLTISPQTENLVHKAIALSGSGLAPWAVAYDPIGYANIVGTSLGYTGKTHKELAKHLITTDINVLHTVISDIKFQNNTPLFAPCIENPELKSNDTVLADAPINVLRSAKYPQIPYIYGYTTREGTLRADEAVSGGWLEGIQANFTKFLPVDLQFGKNTTVVAESIRDFYFGSTPVSMGTVEDFLDFEGDTLVVISVIKAAKERALTSKSEVKLLEFGYVGTRNSDWIYNQIPLTGAKHGDFVKYFFDYDLRFVDEAVSTSILNRFTGFAHWNPATNLTSGNFTWAAITNSTTNYLYYGGNVGPNGNNPSLYVEETRFNPHAQRTAFWSNLYDTYYVAPTHTNSSGVTLSCIVFVVLCQLLVRLF